MLGIYNDRVMRQIMDNLEFEQGMISLTVMIPHALPDVTRAFKKWVATTPFPWRYALDYCLDRARRGRSLPFDAGGSYVSSINPMM